MLLLSLVGCMTLDFMFLEAPTTKSYDLSDEVVPSELTEIITFKSGSKTLYGAWAHQSRPAPPLIFFHGNGGHLQDNWDRQAYYWSWGTHDVFSVDYRGFGMSDGPATFHGVLEEDGAAAIAYVSEVTGVPSHDIPLIGLSLGGAVAIHTNDEVPLRSVILQSTFANADLLIDTSVGLDLPMGWFLEGPYDNVANIARITSPVLIIHGLDDDFILPESGELLHDAAPGPKQLWLPLGVGHSDLFEVKPDAYRDRSLEFMASYE